jgi:hypothetical protein
MPGTWSAPLTEPEHALLLDLVTRERSDGERDLLQVLLGFLRHNRNLFELLRRGSGNVPDSGGDR